MQLNESYMKGFLKAREVRGEEIGDTPIYMKTICYLFLSSRWRSLVFILNFFSPFFFSYQFWNRNTLSGQIFLLMFFHKFEFIFQCRRQFLRLQKCSNENAKECFSKKNSIDWEKIEREGKLKKDWRRDHTYYWVKEG